LSPARSGKERVEGFSGVRVVAVVFLIIYMFTFAQIERR